MVSAAGAIGSEVLKGIGKKYLEEKNAAEKEERKDIDMPRNNIEACTATKQPYIFCKIQKSQ